jgi:cbb3-type cytochrome oxidase subunit 3
VETDIAKGNFSGNNKSIWILIVIFLPFIGSIVYYFVDRKQKLSEPDNSGSRSQDLPQDNTK